jgi:hypothetical protein
MDAIDPNPADAVKWRNGRAASTNNPEALSRVSHQAQTRRRHDLIRVFVNALGGRDAVSDVALMQVKKAAELLALAEMVRAKMLGDPGRDVTGLVRLEGEARRTLAALGIKADVPKAPLALQHRRRARWGAQASQENKAAKAARRREQATPIMRPPDDEEEAAT